MAALIACISPIWPPSSITFASAFPLGAMAWNTTVWVFFSVRGLPPQACGGEVWTPLRQPAPWHAPDRRTLEWGTRSQPTDGDRGAGAQLTACAACFSRCLPEGGGSAPKKLAKCAASLQGPLVLMQKPGAWFSLQSNSASFREDDWKCWRSQQRRLCQR